MGCPSLFTGRWAYNWEDYKPQFTVYLCSYEVFIISTEIVLIHSLFFLDVKVKV